MQGTQQHKPFSVQPSVYPQSSSAVNHQSHSSVVLPSLHINISPSCDARPRLQYELTQHGTDVVTTHITHLSQNSYLMQCQLSTMQQMLQQLQQQLQHYQQLHARPQRQRSQSSATLELFPEEADNDDVEEKELELQELRQWKRTFCAAQTRSLVERVEQLTVRVLKLERQETRCSRCHSSKDT